MRKFLVFSLVALFALASTAFAQDDLSAVDPSGVTIDYWHQFGGAQLETMTALVEEFNSTNEYGITVNAIEQGGYGDIRELMNAGIVSGEVPNLVAGFANDAASYFADGFVVDLNRFVNDETWGFTEEELADIRTDLFAFNSLPSGELIAWPHQFSAQVLITNDTLLEELGYEAPATIDELREIACASAESTGPNGEDRQGYPVTTDASLLEGFINSYGGVAFDGEQYVFSDPAATEALTLFSELYTEGCGYIPAEAFAEQQDLALGLTPFIASSTAGFSFIQGAFEENGSEATWSVHPFPSVDGTPALQIYVPSIIMVPSTPEEEVASWLFLKFLVTEAAGRQWAANTGYFTTSVSGQANLSEEDFSSSGLYEYYAQAQAIIENPETRLYSSPSNVSYGLVRGLISEAIANATSNGQPVADVLEGLNTAANEALAEAGQ